VFPNDPGNRSVHGQLDRGEPWTRTRDRTLVSRGPLRRRTKRHREWSPYPETPYSARVHDSEALDASTLAAGMPAPFDYRALHVRLRADPPEERTHVVWRRLPRGLAHMFTDDGVPLCLRGMDAGVTDAGTRRLGHFSRTDERLCAMCASYSDETWAEEIMLRESKAAAKRQPKREKRAAKPPKKRRGRLPRDVMRRFAETLLAVMKEREKPMHYGSMIGVFEGDHGALTSALARLKRMGLATNRTHGAWSPVSLAEAPA
jgi:hypothetical protein